MPYFFSVPECGSKAHSKALIGSPIFFFKSWKIFNFAYFSQMYDYFRPVFQEAFEGTVNPRVFGPYIYNLDFVFYWQGAMVQ
jgi:hypothetical protein